MKKYYSDGKKLNKKKVILVILIIILLIFLIIFLHTIKNYKIIKSLQNNNIEYSSKTNYHATKTETLNEEQTLQIDYYFKDGKTLTVIKTISEDATVQMSIYSTENEGKSNVYSESTVNPEKIAKLNSDENTYVFILYNGLETANKKEIILMSLFANIKKGEFNGKDCYIVKNIISPYRLIQDNEKDYIDKETGLIVKKVSEETDSEIQYEFGTVTDEDFEEPDISEYTVEE